ncbi:MAG: HD domain-containing protein [Planctomycetota bacterium]
MRESDPEVVPVFSPQPTGTSSATQCLRAVVALARRHQYDAGHAHQVARLAAQLFDALRPLHALDSSARVWLICAAIVHDIAKDSQLAHDAAVLRIVLNTPHLPFDLPTRRLVGLIARYHRKAAPSNQHPHFAALMGRERELVRQLAAILRLADGLDSGHRGLVGRVRCTLKQSRIICRCALAGETTPEERLLLKQRALAKGSLLQGVFGCRLSIRWSA